MNNKPIPRSRPSSTVNKKSSLTNLAGASPKVKIPLNSVLNNSGRGAGGDSHKRGFSMTQTFTYGGDASKNRTPMSSKARQRDTYYSSITVRKCL